MRLVPQSWQTLAGGVGPGLDSAGSGPETWIPPRRSLWHDNTINNADIDSYVRYFTTNADCNDGQWGHFWLLLVDSHSPRNQHIAPVLSSWRSCGGSCSVITPEVKPQKRLYFFLANIFQQLTRAMDQVFSYRTQLGSDRRPSPTVYQRHHIITLPPADKCIRPYPRESTGSRPLSPSQTREES